MTGPERQEDIFGEFTRGQGAVVGLIAIAVMFVLDWIGGEGRAIAAAVSVGALASAIMIFRPLWQRGWFWAAMAVIALVHASAVVLISWPDTSISGIELIPIALGDLAIVVGFIWLLHKVGET